MTSSRRVFLRSSLVSGTAAALLTARSANAMLASSTLTPADGDLAPGEPGQDYMPSTTPNGATLPYKVIDGIKIFHLIAEPVAHTFAPGLEAECWGFNGRVHGPTIEAVEGDRVRIYVTNRLDTATSVHWHGLVVPNGMDGVGGLSQRAIAPGETFKYEFQLRQHGTFMYHSHHDEMTQMAMGMMGMFVVHPRRPEELSGTPVDHDFVYLLSEWKITPGTRRPDPNEMTDFNVLTLNATIFPATLPMVVKQGDRVRIRIGNLSAMDHHPMHLHGHAFEIVATDGGTLRQEARWREVTTLVPVGSTRTIEFVADQLGDWPFHCHMTHHVMTQMGHGIPNLIGVDPSLFDEKIAKNVPAFTSSGEDAPMPDMPGMKMPGMEMSTDVPPNSLPMMGGKGPFGYITMGGMFTILKVRATIEPGKDPGWYEHPARTVASTASDDDLKRDGIDVHPR